VTDLILRNYSLVEKPADTVAGTRCVVLEMWPKHKGKAMRKYWLDEKTGVILKRERHRPDGKTDLLSEFEEFHAGGAISAGRFAIPQAKGVRMVRRAPQKDAANDSDLVRDLGAGGYRTHTLPAGYVREHSVILRKARSVTAHTVYTDGLSYVSLFQTRTKDGADVKPVSAKAARSASLHGPSAQVRTHGGISSVTWQESGIGFTLVSEVRPSLLLHIADEMR
jgi:negative regulator of sigma E activity